MNITACRRILEETEVSDNYFLRLHFCVEAVLKRLMLIGLRLKGLQYAQAETIIKTCRTGIKDCLSTVFNLCGLDYKALKQYGRYAVLEDLFLNYSVPCRNLRVHGVSAEYTGPEMLGLLIGIDKAFVEEIQAFLKENGRPSLFDPPGKWGAVRGKPKDDLKAVYKGLIVKNPAPPRPKYTREQAQELFGRASGRQTKKGVRHQMEEKR
jgi:hypothetical protein